MMLWFARHGVGDFRAPLVATAAAVGMVTTPEYGPWLGVPMLAVVPLMLRIRAMPLEMTLPVAGRSILVARLLVAFVHMLLPALVWCTALLLKGDTTWSLASVVSVGLMLMLAALAPFLDVPTDPVGPPLVRLAVWLLAVLGPGLLLLYFAPPNVMLTVLALATAAMAARVWSRCPQSFVAGARLRGEPFLTVRDAALVRRKNVVWWRPIAAAMFPPMVIVVAVMLFVFGATNDNSVLWFVLSLSLAHTVRISTRWLVPLPFSARQRLWFRLVPSVVLLVLCSELGGLLWPSVSQWMDASSHRAMGVGAPMVTEEYDPAESRSAVRLEYWSVGRADSAPVIQAPWGETQPAYATRILGRVYFNPYSAVKASSPRFVEWQFARATQAVYGRAMTRDEYEAQRKHLPAPLLEKASVHVMSTAGLVCGLLLLVWCAELEHWKRVRHIPGREWFVALLPTAAIISVFSIDLFTPSYIGSGIAVSLLRRELLWLSSALNHNPFLAMLVAALPVVACYALLDWQARQSEAAPVSR